MVPQYDIFRVRDDDTPVWLEPATTFHDAHARVQQFGASEPGEYFIFNLGSDDHRGRGNANGERLESRRRGSTQGRRSGHVHRPYRFSALSKTSATSARLDHRKMN